MKRDKGRVEDRGWKQQVNRRKMGLSEGKNAGTPELEEQKAAAGHMNVSITAAATREKNY